MEPITHLLTGACLARLGFNRKTALATLTMTLAAEAPDIDLVAYVKGSVSGFVCHRGATHTLWGIPLVSALVLALVYAGHRLRQRFWPAFHPSKPKPGLPGTPRFRRRRVSHWLAPAIAVWLLLLASSNLGWGESAGMRGQATISPSPSAAAAVALFVNSNPDAARSLAAAALRQNPSDEDALFITMEAAALEADTSAETDAALRLCATADSNGSDPRARIAASRLTELAGNTSQFRAAIPRIQKLIASGSPHREALRQALVAAAVEGAPGLDLRELAKQAGLVTDWRLVGPFGQYANLDVERVFAPERDGLAQARYDADSASAAPLRAERFQFDDGNFHLPDYFAQEGVFYAAAEIEVPAAGTYKLRAESAGTLVVFVDSAPALRKDDRFRATPQIASTTLPLAPGKHSLLVKFIASGAPFRIALVPAAAPDSASVRREIATMNQSEADYLEAAERFWAGDYDAAIARLTRLHDHQPSAAVDFLSQPIDRGHPHRRSRRILGASRASRHSGSYGAQPVPDHHQPGAFHRDFLRRWRNGYGRRDLDRLRRKPYRRVAGRQPRREPDCRPVAGA